MGELVWVESQLSKWGRWALKSGSGALGYATMSILASHGIRDDDAGMPDTPRDLVDNDIYIIDAAVSRLPEIQIIVVVRVYVLMHGKSDRKIANALCISRQALSSYLNAAHQRIALDISNMPCQNTRQSVIGGIAPRVIQPATA